MRFARRCQPAGWAQCAFADAAWLGAAALRDASTAVLPPQPAATIASAAETPASGAKGLIAAMVDGLPPNRSGAPPHGPRPTQPRGSDPFPAYRGSAHGTVTEAGKKREDFSP